MSILTAIFQAIFQAITQIFPLSESGHSSLFHHFAGRLSGNCSVLTGVIHIGIAVGIVAALYKLFFTLSKELLFTASDIFKKQLKGSKPSPRRKFMYMTLVSFVPLVLWLIPTGKYGFFYHLLSGTAFNNTVLDDGVFLMVTGLLVLLAARMLTLAKNNKNINVIFAVVIGVLLLFFVPIAGFSIIGCVFAVLMLLGVSKKLALRYSFVLTAPLLLVTGIVETCVGTPPQNWVQIVLGVLLSAGVSYIGVKAMQWIVNNNKLKYFGIYDVALGAIAFIIGIFGFALN